MICCTSNRYGKRRVWEKIAEGMQLVASNITGLKARISSWAKGIGLRGNHSKMEGYFYGNIYMLTFTLFSCSRGKPFGWSVANHLYFKRVGE